MCLLCGSDILHLRDELVVDFRALEMLIADKRCEHTDCTSYSLVLFLMQVCSSLNFFIAKSFRLSIEVAVLVDRISFNRIVSSTSELVVVSLKELVFCMRRYRITRCICLQMVA